MQRVIFITGHASAGAYYSQRRQDTGTPLPIAVSSFGESLRRVTPLTAPAEACF